MIGNDLKEYPATHSMSTSWFFADEEGNVADFEFQDNGPVPEKTCSSNSCLESMLMNDFSSKDENGIPHFPLNKKQAEHLLSFLEPAEESDVVDAVVQIDIAKKEDFLSYFSDKDKSEDLVCFSEELGLYAVNYFEEGTYTKMIQQGIIIKKGNWDFWFNDILNENNEVKWENVNAEMYPFYIYQQEYNPRKLMTKTITPENPFKLSQLPTHIQSKVVRLPLKFSQYDKIQIAEYFPFEKTMFMDDENTLGLSFHLLPTESGAELFFASSIFSEFCDWDSENSFWPHCTSLSPTILYISTNIRHYDFHNIINELEEFLQHNCAAISTNITNVIPSPLIKLKEKGIPIPENVAAHVSDKAGYLEQAFDDVHPRVVIIFEDALPKLRQWETDTHEFSMDANHIRINGCDYPYFLWNDVENNIKEIRELASLPYRGRKRCVLSEEEFKVWQKLNELCKE